MMVEGQGWGKVRMQCSILAANELWGKKICSPVGQADVFFETLPATDKVGGHFWTCQR